ncbi:hypothetical protein IG631_08648 [Alternaria alternata]|nr:hypothetical protein IG631_08648 [Alternaria alternata]
MIATPASDWTLIHPNKPWLLERARLTKMVTKTLRYTRKCWEDALHAIDTSRSRTLWRLETLVLAGGEIRTELEHTTHARRHGHGKSPY